MSTSPEPQSVIEIKPSYFFLAFLLAFFKPKASINGSAPIPLNWGSNPVPVPPGRYQVEVWLPYLFLSQMGKNGTVIDVAAGGAVQVHWRAPWIVFMKGSISLAGGAHPGAVPPQAMPPQGLAASTGAAAPTGGAAPAGWHADPAGRHQLRYYDGSAWTDHVSDAGVQATDPVGG